MIKLRQATGSVSDKPRSGQEERRHAGAGPAKDIRSGSVLTDTVQPEVPCRVGSGAGWRGPELFRGHLPLPLLFGLVPGVSVYPFNIAVDLSNLPQL